MTRSFKSYAVVSFQRFFKENRRCTLLFALNNNLCDLALMVTASKSVSKLAVFFVHEVSIASVFFAERGAIPHFSYPWKLALPTGFVHLSVCARVDRLSHIILYWNLCLLPSCPKLKTLHYFTCLEFQVGLRLPLFQFVPEQGILPTAMSQKRSSQQTIFWLSHLRYINFRYQIA